MININRLAHQINAMPTHIDSILKGLPQSARDEVIRIASLLRANK